MRGKAAPHVLAGRLAATVAAGLCGGFVFHGLGIPSGMLFGSMAGVGALALTRFPIFRHRWSGPVAQLLVGIGIGSTINGAALVQVREMIVPIIGSVVTLMVSGFLFGLWLHRAADIDHLSAIAATAPGGMVEIILLTEELGSPSAVVAAIHVFRVITVLGTLPLSLWILT